MLHHLLPLLELPQVPPVLPEPTQLLLEPDQLLLEPLQLLLELLPELPELTAQPHHLDHHQLLLAHLVQIGIGMLPAHGHAKLLQLHQPNKNKSKISPMVSSRCAMQTPTIS